MGNYFLKAPTYSFFYGLFIGTFEGDIGTLRLQNDEVSEAVWMPLVDVLSLVDNNTAPFVETLPAALNALGHTTQLNTIEYAHIVDRNDRLLCYKPRDELSSNDIIRTTSVWIEDGKGNVLTQTRSNTLTYWPGRIDSAGGGLVNSCETPEQNAEKELREELGIHHIDLSLVKKTFLNSSGDIGGFLCYWFKAVINQPIEKFHIQPSEVASLRWVPKSKLLHHRDTHPELYMSSSVLWRKLFA
jgi:8-oxo-dGTP pyrophosphatase MutT (NUDIX family)